MVAKGVGGGGQINWEFGISRCKLLHCFLGGASGKESSCQHRRRKRRRFDPCVGQIPWSSKWQLAPVFLPGKFHGQRNLAGYSPSGCKELDTAEHTCILPRFTSSNILGQKTFSSSPNKGKKKKHFSPPKQGDLIS